MRTIVFASPSTRLSFRCSAWNSCRVLRAEDGVRGEERPEEEHLGREEGPDAELGAISNAGAGPACSARGSLMTAGPFGFPYPYGQSVTVGISWKFSVSGGEGICHSRVSARHGFAGARLPLAKSLEDVPAA